MMTPNCTLSMVQLNLLKKIVRASILKTGKRIDGRDLNTVRDIDVRVIFLKMFMVVHCLLVAKHKL